MNKTLLSAALAVVLAFAPGCSNNSTAGGNTASGSIGVSRDDKLVYAADSDLDTLFVVDTRTTMVVSEIALGRQPEKVLVAPRRHRLRHQPPRPQRVRHPQGRHHRVRAHRRGRRAGGPGRVHRRQDALRGQRHQPHRLRLRHPDGHRHGHPHPQVGSARRSRAPRHHPDGRRQGRHLALQGRRPGDGRPGQRQGRASRARACARSSTPPRWASPPPTGARSASPTSSAACPRPAPWAWRR